jgi:chromosome segregation ATPase
MSSRNGYPDYVRDDEQRRREDTQQYGMQQQIDELRQVIRELTTRCARLEDQLKTSQSAAAQDRLALEQHQHEVSQAAQARQLEEARVREALGELSNRIDDSTRPIRTLQAHVSELIEAVRRFRDEDTDVDKRIDDLRSHAEHLSAHHERQVVNLQGLRDQIESLRGEIDRTQREQHHTNDAVKIVEHEFKRRLQELHQEIIAYDTKFRDYSSVWQTLQVQIDAVKETAESQIGRIDTVEVDIEQVAGEISGILSQTRERDDMNAQRIEEVRQRLDSDVQDLRDSDEQRHVRIDARIDDLEQLDRDVSYRVNMLEMTLDELRQDDARVRRDLWYLHEQRVRSRMEQIQEELEQVREARREAERRWAMDPDDPEEEQEQD